MPVGIKAVAEWLIADCIRMDGKACKCPKCGSEIPSVADHYRCSCGQEFVRYGQKCSKCAELMIFEPGTCTATPQYYCSKCDHVEPIGHEEKVKL